MPGKVKVKVLAGRNLPIMDRGSLTTDAYVEIKLGNICHKTEVAKKTLNPQWSSDWFRFEVDDAELQDEPLQIRIMDYDTYSANDVIGKVYLSLNPLLLPNSLENSMQKSGKGSVMSGWIPVYDTLQGIRGEVNVIVKVDLFSDVNKFRQSSCGLQFFCSPCTPNGYTLQAIHGFVEELIVNDDPEYQWIDKIRTPRASNEARQVAFLKLSGQVQRKIGLKAIEMGANAVIAYKQSFDLENDIGVVARGTGTAVTLTRAHEGSQPIYAENTLLEEKMRRSKNLSSSMLSTNFANIGASTNSVIRMSTEQIFKEPPSLLPSHAYSSGDITILTDQPSIQILLDQEDSRLPEEKGKGYGWKLKPKLFFQKHLKLRNRKTRVDSLLAHSFSDLTSNIKKKSKGSLYDFENPSSLLTKKKSNLSSSGSNMTKVLVRSVMVAPFVMSGLDKIAEHDTHVHVSNDDSKMLPKINIVDSINEQESLENNLTVSSMSITSISTGSASSLSEDDDDDDDGDDEGNTTSATTSGFAVSEPETVSMVVKSVLENERRALRTSVSDTRLSDELFKSIPIGKFEVVKDSKGHVISDPFIVESSARLEDIQKLLETSNEETSNWIQPGSTTDEPEIEDEPRHYIINNLSEKIHHLQDHLHLPFHEHTGIIHHHNQPGLLETAMATMLIEKLNICEASAGILPVEVPESPLPEKKKRFVDEVRKKLTSKFGDFTHNSPSLLKRGSSEPCFRKYYIDSDDEIEFSNKSPHRDQTSPNNRKHLSHKDSILKSFKETLHHLGEQIHTTDVKHNIVEKIHKLQEKVHLPHFRAKSESRKHHGLLETAMQTILIDKANLMETQAGFSPETTNERKNSITAFRKRLSITTKNLSLDLPIFGRKKRLDSDASIGKDSVETLKNESLGSNRTIKTVKEASPIYSEKCDVSLLNIKHHLSLSDSNLNVIVNLSKPKFFSLNNLFRKESFTQKLSFYVKNIVEPNNNYLLDATCNTPLNITNQSSLHASSSLSRRNEVLSSPFHPRTESITGRPQVTTTAISSSIGREIPSLAVHHRRSSDSDLSITPKVWGGRKTMPSNNRHSAIFHPEGNSLNSADKLNPSMPKTSFMRPTLIQDNLEMLEYPFLTMNKFPPGFILHLGELSQSLKLNALKFSGNIKIGATVAARSVKLLERVPNPDEPETRDSWWNELRMEIRSHARAIGCNVVLGYSEATTITDDVCVLSATGTAAIVNLSYVGDTVSLDNSGSSRKDHVIASSLEKRDGLGEKISDSENETLDPYKREHITNPVNSPSPGINNVPLNCSICHIPYSQNSLPFKANMSKCAICKRRKVPDVLLATIEIPDVQITGRACLIQAHVCRYKRDLKSEANAKEISDGLPFLEYELHRQLICKLKVKGMNAIFGLKTSLAVGERMIALVATGSAVFISCLPSPTVPKIVAGNSWTDAAKLDELQKTVQETQERNKEIFQTKVFQDIEINNKIAVPSISDTDDSDDELIELDLTLGNRDSCVLEVDDIQDLEVVALLMECNPPDGIYVVNTESIPGLQDLDVVKHLQMFSQVWRAKIPANQPNSSFSKHFQRLLQTIYFKLRTMIPCVIAGLKFLIDLPEADEMQILVTGMAYSFGESNKNKFKKRMIAHSISKDGTRRLDDDLIFNLEEDVDTTEQHPNLLHTGSLRLRKKSPTRAKNKIARHAPLRERYGVDITPLSYVPGGQVDKYLGNLNFFFIRESTSIRENGGISGFVHSFITEILAMIRAHVSCLGGNAIVSFYMTELMLVDNPHKNQGQCLISVGGDVVFVSDLIDD